MCASQVNFCLTTWPSTALPASSALFVQIVNTLACPPLNHLGHLGPEGQLLLGA